MEPLTKMKSFIRAFMWAFFRTH